jgi:hypothetical protein
MSEHVWCHGPSCHLSHTQDRVRGVKGSKVLRTRKVTFNSEHINMYSYFCSQGCYNDFAHKYVATSHCHCTEDRAFGNTC